jgi:preprotein translocase subunit Sec63
MDVIDIDGKKYDPYFILGVTKDDTGERITKTYREKVKRYFIRNIREFYYYSKWSP